MSGETTLYEEFGGEEAIEAVVDRFYERVLADDQLASFFEETDMDALRAHQTLFISALTGGPVEYDGRDMETAHADLEITEDDFWAVADHLAATLEEFGVPDEQVDAVLAEVADLRPVIVSA